MKTLKNIGLEEDYLVLLENTNELEQGQAGGTAGHLWSKLLGNYGRVCTLTAECPAAGFTALCRD